ncbi:MAG: hypothetical protein ACREOC_13575 [Gemmatimonadales bacterium]
MGRHWCALESRLERAISACSSAFDAGDPALTLDQRDRDVWRACIANTLPSQRIGHPWTFALETSKPRAAVFIDDVLRRNQSSRTRAFVVEHEIRAPEVTQCFRRPITLELRLSHGQWKPWRVQTIPPDSALSNIKWGHTVERR